MLGQQWHQMSAAHQWGGRGSHQLAHCVAAQYRAGLDFDVVGAERGQDVTSDDVIAYLEFPGHGLAGGSVAKATATVLGQISDACGRSVASDVRG